MVAGRGEGIRVSLSIGRVAERTGVGVQTVRFYEKQGLLRAPARSSSGYREYDPSVLARLGFIRRAQELGFTLKEIRELLALQENENADCADVRRAAVSKLGDVQQRMADLKRMSDALQGLVDSCSGDGPAAQCSIMHCFSEC